MKKLVMLAVMLLGSSVFANQGTEKENSKRDNPSSNTYENQMPTEKTGSSHKAVKKGKKSTQSTDRPDIERGVNTGTPSGGGGTNNDMDKNRRSENE